MPDFVPFPGLGYGAAADHSAVAAPPYDVIDEEERAALEQADPHNSVRLILPRDADGADRYQHAAATLDAWRAEGVLVDDPDAAFHAYAMEFVRPDGSPARTTGVIGALALPEGPGDVLPHEQTLPKARSDRLALLRATRTNLDPIWGLSLAPGLTGAIGSPTPVARAREADGTLHELGRVTDPERVERIRALVGSAPLVLADGHHRYETARAYRDERPGDPGAAAIMTFVVELAEEQLFVRPIHRLLAGGPAARPEALRELLGEAFHLEPLGANAPDAVEALERAMDDQHGLGLIDGLGAALLVPRPERLGAALERVAPELHDVDSARFDALVGPTLAEVELTYRDDAQVVAGMVQKGAADATILLRGVAVETIRAVAFAGLRMPPKTTYFAPKPRTGLVFRRLDG